MERPLRAHHRTSGQFVSYGQQIKHQEEHITQLEELLARCDRQATRQERLLLKERSQRAEEEDRRRSAEAAAKDARSEAKRAKTEAAQALRREATMGRLLAKAEEVVTAGKAKAIKMRKERNMAHRRPRSFGHSTHRQRRMKQGRNTCRASRKSWWHGGNC